MSCKAKGRDRCANAGKTEDEHIFEQEVDTTHSRGAVSVNKLEKKRGMNEMTTSKILPKKRVFFTLFSILYWQKKRNNFLAEAKRVLILLYIVLMAKIKMRQKKERVKPIRRGRKRRK